MKRLGFIIIFLTIFILQGNGQEVEVLDSKNKMPVPHVAVFNPNKDKAVITDDLGKAKLDVFAITDTLFFQHPSFQTIGFTKKELEQFGYRVQLFEKVKLLGEVVLSASRFEEKKEEVPMQMQIIQPEAIGRFNPSTTADVLGSSGQVMIQKSQLGGGSPILRGFEANKVLLVVDGVRMNNAIYRSGHLQNVVTIDNLVLDRVEVVYGPGSVIYGSDALGGVMHFISKSPSLPGNDSTVNSSVNGLVRYASATNEQTTHFNFNVGFEKLGIFTGITNSNYGDLKMGSIRSKEYPEFGKVNHYSVMTAAGEDSMVTNEDPNIQRPTGYSQVNLIQKVLYRPSAKLDLGLNLQYTTTSNIPRFDKLNDRTNDTLKFAEWHYGPQRRIFSAITADLKAKQSWYDKAHVVLAYQKIDEDRISRKFSYDERIIRQENVGVLTGNLSFYKKLDSLRSFQYGLEAGYNDVVSEAYSENIHDSARSYATTRYPDGGSTMQSYGAFLTYKWQLSPAWLLNSGVRYSQFLVRARFIDTSTYQLPFNEINNVSSSFSGSMGVIYQPSDYFRYNLLVSSGFRAPNVDDLGKVFAKEAFVTVPNDQLLPEKIYSGEMGGKLVFFNGKAEINVTGYYSILTDAIVRREATINGQDSLYYDGEKLRILTNVNTGKAVIYGSTAQLATNFRKLPNIEGAITYTYGWDLEEDMPLSHIPPLFGRLALSKSFGQSNFDPPVKMTFYSNFNGWKTLDQYGSSSVDNLAEATVDGTPSWVTLNATFSYKIRIKSAKEDQSIGYNFRVEEKSLVFQLGVENILDHHYKPFSSGMSAPGRNFIVSLRASF